MVVQQENVEVEIPPGVYEGIVAIEIPQANCKESANAEILSAADLDTCKEVGNRWEDDADRCVHSSTEIWPWNKLWEQIKQDLKKNSNCLPLLKINQLLVIRNFAMLWLKGYGRIQASEEIAQQWHEGEGKHYVRQV